MELARAAAGLRSCSYHECAESVPFVMCADGLARQGEWCKTHALDSDAMIDEDFEKQREPSTAAAQQPTFTLEQIRAAFWKQFSGAWEEFVEHLGSTD